MRFNPPPNWPQLPPGWSPPPGWQPDRSWPQPPPGWRLWVDEDEFVISPHRTAAWPAQPTQAWHQRTVSVVLFLVFFFPVGLVLLWLRRDWSVRRRGIVTAVVGVFALIVVAGANPPPATTTALSPTTVGETASASPAPASSRSASRASPAPVVTKSLTPATSAPPKTTAAAPVHTSAAPVRTTAAPAPVRTSAAPVHTTAAPVHTTTAPQPVQTTAQKQSCYPLTNSGKCYTPGEYCRTADRGTSGIDADGDPITCEDNDGWRWERT